MQPQYKPLELLIGPARGHDELWRTIIGCVAIALVYILLCMVSGSILGFAYQPGAQSNGAMAQVLQQMFCVGALAAGVWIVVHLFHARRARTVLGSWLTLKQDALRAFFGVGVLMMLVIGLSTPLRSIQPIANVDVWRWALVLPLSLSLLLWQVLGEEMAFRGYLLPQIAARYRSPLVWLGVPAVVFGVLHFSVVDFGPNAIVVSLWACMFGIALGDLTARTGSIGAALGVHLAYNTATVLFVALPGPWAAIALYRLPFAGDSAEFIAWAVPAEFFVVLLCWLTARLVIRR